MLRFRLPAAAGLGLALALAAQPAYAHGFGERYDLPVPLSFFLIGAAASVAFSFVVMGLFINVRPGPFRYPRYNLLAVRWLRPALACPITLAAIKAVSLCLFVMLLAAALLGTHKPIENLSPTFVWIIWWVGMGYVSAAVGNVWMLVNPWKIVYEWVEKLAGGGSDQQDGGMARYPDNWDTWPAVAIFFLFAWVENVYPDAALPFRLGLLILLYSALTWGGMLVFGKHTWLRYGEAFSVLFGFFSRFSPTEVRTADARLCRRCELDCGSPDGECVDCYACFERAQPEQRQLNLRPYAVGLVPIRDVSLATAGFVVLALATVTFDGLSETPPWFEIRAAAFSAMSPTFGPGTMDVIDTLGLMTAPLGFTAVYLAFSWGIKQLSGDRLATASVASAFVLSLIPIALAYHLAHFISLIVIQGQEIIPLASDPFGAGWDLFGTAGYRVNIAAISAKTVWFTSVVAIVVGHITSVYTAHVIAMGRTEDRRAALLGQLPMLALMVTYTAVSLWILAQPIVEQG